MNTYVILGIVILLPINVVAWRMDPVVVGKMGQIRGRRSADGSHFKFMGIPFAEVNRSNPFGNANPVAPFEEIFDANEDLVMCPQKDYFSDSDIGTLDCLRLNILVPNSALIKSLPVLVWIHGGRFSFSYGNHDVWDPKYLVGKDVIFVSINSRVNIYGYLCLNTPEAPGNQGLKDQLIALKWIKENIESFGGNPDCITLMGDSSGAVLADLHAHFDKEKLFNQLILPGGSMFKNLFSYRRDDTKMLFKVAELLGFSTNSTSEALSYLIISNPTKVAVVTDKLKILFDFKFSPCVENSFDNVEPFIKDDPILKIPNVKGMTVMTSHGSDDARFRHAKNNQNSYKNWKGFYNLLQTHFDFKGNDLDYFERIVKNFYIGDSNIGYEQQQKLIDFESDLLYNYPMHRLLDKYIHSGAEKVYYSVFCYNGSRNLVKYVYGNNAGGAAHGDYLGYLFDWPRLPQPTPQDQLIIERITTMWTNFVKYGDPTPETSELFPVRWVPVTQGSPRYYLNIDTAMSLGTNPFRERMAFWDTFYEINSEFVKGYLHKNVTRTDSYRNSTAVVDKMLLSSTVPDICPVFDENNSCQNYV